LTEGLQREGGIHEVPEVQPASVAGKMVAFAQSVAQLLDHMLIETQMIRRHAPAIVRDARNDPRVNRPIVDFALTHPYVAAR
jgi:LuxR family transcriptional regulator, regulator of acetate metabolism